jgi:hypothetical protein
MNARLLFAALAIPCLCAAAEEAIGQDRSAYGPQDRVRPAATPNREAESNSPRLPVIEERERSRPVEMIESWQVGDQAELGLGRFQVGEIARARSHNERVREDLMARENRAIAGAGVRIRFD